eukprot:15452820-Alexandrium_andersonii.AAC.1
MPQLRQVLQEAYEHCMQNRGFVGEGSDESQCRGPVTLLVSTLVRAGCELLEGWVVKAPFMHPFSIVDHPHQQLRPMCFQLFGRARDAITEAGRPALAANGG